MRTRRILSPIAVLLDLCGGATALFAVDVGDGEGPEGNEGDAGDELDGEGGSELPVPAEEQAEGDAENSVDNVVGRGESAFDEERETDELHEVCRDGEDEGKLESRARQETERGGFGLIGRLRSSPDTYCIDPD